MPPPLPNTHTRVLTKIWGEKLYNSKHTLKMISFVAFVWSTGPYDNWYGKLERVVTFFEFTMTISPLLPKPPFSSQVKVIGQFVYNRTGRFPPMTEIFSFKPETFLVVVYLTCKHIVGPMSWCRMSGRWAVWGFPFAGQKRMSTNAFSVDASWSLCTIPMAICSLDFFFLFWSKGRISDLVGTCNIVSSASIIAAQFSSAFRCCSFYWRTKSTQIIRNIFHTIIHDRFGRRNTRFAAFVSSTRTTRTEYCKEITSSAV